MKTTLLNSSPIVVSQSKQRSGFRATLARFVPIVLALSAAGCEDTQSTELATADLRLDAYATAGHQIEVYVHRAETADLVELAGGDRLVATVDGKEMDVPYDGTIASVYRVDVPDDIGEVTLSLLRESGDDAAITVVVPPDPDITSATSFSRADEDLTVTWANPQPELFTTVFVDSCADIEIEIGGSKSVVKDEGSFTLPMSEVLAEAGSTADCATLHLLRRAHPASTGGFHPDSAFPGRRYSSFEIDLTP